jgi:hypothetical protein
MSLIFFSTQGSPVFGTAQAAGRLVPRLRNRIEGLGDQEKQTSDIARAGSWKVRLSKSWFLIKLIFLNDFRPTPVRELIYNKIVMVLRAWS